MLHFEEDLTSIIRKETHFLAQLLHKYVGRSDLQTYSLLLSRLVAYFRQENTAQGILKELEEPSGLSRGGRCASESQNRPSQDTRSNRQRPNTMVPGIQIQSSPSPGLSSQPLIPSEQSNVDREYIILSEDFPGAGPSSESVHGLTATILEHDPNTAQRQSENDALAAMDDWIKSDGAFRIAYIRFDNDPEGTNAKAQCVMHDTGSARSLTFRSKLQELGMPFEPFQYQGGTLTSITGHDFKPIGRRQICFSYEKKPDKVLWVNVLVLDDPPTGLKPSFDFLLGRDFIKKERIVIWDKDIIGVITTTDERNAVQHLSDRILAIPASTPRSSFVATASESESARTLGIT